jgi:hypothetical protein
MVSAAIRAAENILRFLKGEIPYFIAGDDVRMT